jgi:L-asparaginase II
MLASAGEPGLPVYLRSAAKPFQAMPLLEAGGERAFRLGSGEIALTCASHGGQPRHVRAVAGLLARGGFAERDLACGGDRPMHEGSAQALLRRGESPSPLHNNCSGKHAGLLLACRLYGFSARGYWQPGHPIQREVLARVAAWTSVPPGRIGIGVDGCSLPVFHLPLAALAIAYAKLLSRSAGPAAARIRKAMWQRPDMMAGSGRFTTAFLAVGRGRWIGKEGAEGVYAIGIRPPRGDREACGIAFKIEDGSTRARDAIALALLERLGLLPAPLARGLSAYRDPPLQNARGLTVGRVESDARPVKLSGFKARARPG